MESPIFHIHVKVVKKDFHDDRWFAQFMEPGGRKTWVEQPMEPEVGSEQILYVIRNGTKENQQLGRLMSRGASVKEVERFLLKTARRYDEACDKSWDEVAAQNN
jgi:hypothetical protein